MAAPTHSVITFATNNRSYMEFAMNCAQSVLLRNDLPVYIVSNLDYQVPAKFRDKIFIIPAKPEHLHLGIGIKLYTDQYLQTEHTLFIDSDCICYGDLNKIFKACEGMDVTVAGNIVPTENWCGTVLADTIKENWGIERIIRYNGGLYYFKRSALTTAIFNKAREIGDKYDEYGFHRIKNKWINEEGPISVAMMLNQQLPIPDDGQFITDLYTDMRPARINVLQGKLRLRNNPTGHRKHRSWYPAKYSPIILHFGGNNISSYPYKSQKLLLKFYRKHMPAWLSTALINTFIHVPYRSFHLLRKTLKF